MKVTVGKDGIAKIQSKLKSLQAPLTRAQASDLGSKVVVEMWDMIEKGISPIKGPGIPTRFPRYLGQSRAQASKSAITQSRAQLRETTSLFGSSKSSRAIGRELSRAAKDAKRTQNASYPYNQKNKYPDKKVTPVNLTLSGEFLGDLTFNVKPARNSRVGHVVEVGYFKEESILKEIGHREGANGQPKRPTIPSGSGETFAARILRIIRDALIDAID